MLALPSMTASILEHIHFERLTLCGSRVSRSYPIPTIKVRSVMTDRQATCFVSYCRENADLNSIRYLVRQLREVSNNQIHFFFDEDATGGIKLTDFMSQIRKVDAILLLLTPQYRRRVLERRRCLCRVH
jgi:hypothetical protein